MRLFFFIYAYVIIIIVNLNRFEYSTISSYKIGKFTIIVTSSYMIVKSFESYILVYKSVISSVLDGNLFQ